MKYVGPRDIREKLAGSVPGHAVDSPAALRAWWDAREDDVATFVVTTDGMLRIAPRRSEHVACAGGGEVLAAGELGFARRGNAIVVDTATNQSTGFCPPIESWGALAAVLDAAGIAHPPAWTAAFEFRRCPACGERNIVKDDWWQCALCDADLPRAWNFETTP